MFDSKSENSIYHIVDEDFLNGFDKSQQNYMKNFYYSFYYSYCISRKIKTISKKLFFKNMRRRKIKIIQCFCPFCGHIDLFISHEKIPLIKKIKYCSNCGKKSVFENSMIHLSRFARVSNGNQLLLNSIKEKSTLETEILTFDMYHLEVIELTSIIEVTLRDFFKIFILLKYENTFDDYLIKLIDKSTGNDFMNILKANEHYKKALSLNLKDFLTVEHWNNLNDVSSIRNVLIHNNGFIDDKFKNTPSFKRYKKSIKGNMLFLNKEIINQFVESITELMEVLDSLYQKEYINKIYNIIANFYFRNER